MSSRSIRSRLLTLGLVALAALPATADFLRTKDGALVETKGPWSVRRGQVVFELPNGTLASMRLSEVDLDASAVATEEARRPEARPEDAPEEVREPILTLTMKDIRQVAAPSEDAEEAASVEAGEPAVAESRYEPVQVAGWVPVEGSTATGTEILGTLRNDGPRIVTGISVTAKLLGTDGEELGTAQGFVNESSLVPEMTTQFRALFPEVTVYADAVFEVRSTEIVLEDATPPTTGAGGR